MIPIRHQNLEQIAQKHAQAVLDYVQNSAKEVSRQKINNAIGLYLPGETLESILHADIQKLNELASYHHSRYQPIPPPEDFSYFITLYEYFNEKDKFKTTNFEEGRKIPYTARTLVDWLGISVCPYCNRNFIYNAGKKRSSELDHFYPKDVYPWLAVSFYNLIPSCKVCNQEKSTHPLVINPYQSDAFKDWRFKLTIQSPNFYHSTDGFTIKLDESKLSDEETKAQRQHISCLSLDEQYHHHKDHVLELIQRNVVYSDAYIDSLFAQFEGTLFRSREDVLRLAHANFISEDEIHKRPLAKLTKDILKQLE